MMNMIAPSTADSAALLTDRLAERTDLDRRTALARLASPSLFVQLRAHYPQGCLLSELAHAPIGADVGRSNLFIVRALVQSDGLTLATALAAAPTVEAAEAQARLRVLELLGIAPLHPVAYDAVPPVGLVLDLSAPGLMPNFQAAAPSNSAPLAAPLAAPIAVAAPTAALTVQSVAPPPAALRPEPVVATPDEADALEMEFEYTVEDAAPSSPAADFAADPIDLSDVIAQIGTEIDRIGWSKKQGSAYLQGTYGKRTRAELTEPELVAFLKYLKSLPAKVQPALSDLPF
jgi:hypothetical protein